MTKFFKAQVTIQKTVQVIVAAENDDDAREKATELALRKEVPGSCVSRIEVTPDGETEYGVGTMVKHFIFGSGEIINLSRIASFENEAGFMATIKFETGDVKDIHLPMPKDKLEIIEL